MSTASATDQAPFASTRIAASGRTSRMAATRCALSGSPTLTLIVRHPEATAISAACAGGTAGTMAFTSTWLRTGFGHRPSACSMAHASQRASAARS